MMGDIPDSDLDRMASWASAARKCSHISGSEARDVESLIARVRELQARLKTAFFPASN